jgi:hypothetical protein
LEITDLISSSPMTSLRTTWPGLALFAVLGLGCGSVRARGDGGAPGDSGGQRDGGDGAAASDGNAQSDGSGQEGGGQDSAAPGDGSAQGDGGGQEGGAGRDSAADLGGSDQATAACDPTLPFGAVTPLAAFNTTASDDAVSLSRDLLTAYLSSNRPGGVGGYDIWFATRTAPTQEFAAPRLLEGVNTLQDERSPVTSRDGLQLFFSSNFQASGLHDIRVSTRPSMLATFSASAPLAGINSPSNDASQWLSANDTLIYFFSDRPGGLGSYDVWVANLGPSGTSNVRPVAELNTMGFDTAPVVTPDGLTIFFSSNRADVRASGGNDIWTARRSTSSDGFGAPRIVAELNTPSSDAVTWVSADGCTVYIQSDRDTPTDVPTAYDLYEASRGR